MKWLADGSELRLRRLGRSFFSPPSFSVPAVVSMAFVAAVGLAILGTFRIDSLRPIALTGGLPYPLISDADFGLIFGPHLVTNEEQQVTGMSRFFLVLGGVGLAAVAVGLVNLTILFKNRAGARAQNQAVEMAIGARPARLAWERLLGAALLLTAAVAIGLATGYLGSIAARSFWPFSDLPSLFGIHPIGPMLVLAALLLLTGVLSARGHPAVRTETGVRQLLAGGGRLKGTRFPEGLRSLLPAAQIGLSLTLLMGSSVLLGSVMGDVSDRSGQVDLGNVWRLPVEVEKGHDSDGGWEDFLAGLRGMDGVEQVAFFTPGAWTGLGRTDGVWTECGQCFVGNMWLPMSSPFVRHHVVSADSFSAMGVRVLEGREFRSTDGPASPLVAVVNETYARLHFDSEGPIGRSLGIGRNKDSWHEVVGIVEDFGFQGIGSSEAPEAAVFLSSAQHPPDAGDVLFRYTGEAGEAPLTAGSVIGPDGPQGPIGDPEPLLSHIQRSMAALDWFTGITIALGLFTLAMAAFGLYAILDYSVTLRTEEIGVRRALGAGHVRVVALLLKRTGAILGLGLFLGLEGALFLTAGLEEIALEGQVFDLGRFMLLSAVMTGGGLIGTLRPAVKALRIPPREAMGGI